MNEELVKVNTETELAQPVGSTDDTGLGDVTKMAPTRLQLVQPTTLDSQGAKIGQLLDTGTGLAYDEVEVVPFKMWRSRVFFPPGQQVAKGTEPLCRSTNGNFPTADSKVKQSNSCDTCIRSQWVNRKPPECKEKLDLIVINTASDMPHFVSAGGLSFAGFRKKLNGLSSLVMQARKKGVKADAYNYTLTLGTEKDKKTNNYLLIIKAITELKDDAKAFYENMYNALKKSADTQATMVATEQGAVGAVGEVLEGEVVEV